VNPADAAVPGRHALDLSRVRALFDLPVVVCQARTGELPFDALPGRVRADLGEVAAMRRRTFAAGRLAAARSTAELTGRRRWLRASSSGAPVWPPGVSGSLSHTNDVAVCVATASVDCRVGIDIEPMASAGFLRDATRLICSPAERDLLADAKPDPVLVLRLFCAKEALFKALPASLQRGWRPRSTTFDWAESVAGAEPVRLRVAAGTACGATVSTAAINGVMVAGLGRL
jgi:4'-phosphopantetheinyl transferase EntD